MNRTVYIAQNAELSSLYAGEIVFKVGVTDRAIGMRIQELNGGSMDFPDCAMYAGSRLSGQGKWSCDRKNRRPATEKFEELLKDDIVRHGGQKLRGYTTLKGGKRVRCQELFVVVPKFKSVYLEVDSKGRPRFRRFFPRKFVR